MDFSSVTNFMASDEEKTKPSTKSAKKNLIIGNMTVVVNQTYLATDPFDGSSTEYAEGTKILPPDFYREGRYVTSTDADGNPIQLWAPSPESIAARSTYDRQNLATIRLIKADDTSKGQVYKNLIPPHTKFFLEQVIEPHDERFQLIETFGDWFIIFYGERPPVYTFGGVLLSAMNYDWHNEFHFLYDAFLRGTRAAEQKAAVSISYGTSQAVGYLLGKTVQLQAIAPNAAAFSFKMVVSKRFILSTKLENAFSDSLVQSQETINALKAQLDKSMAENPSLFESITKVAEKQQDPASMNDANSASIKPYADLIKANKLKNYQVA